ncbi:hypothetical protein CLAFUW4_04839 [Fulvia fulva]|uniref:Uncharacterized protein n=1 Tax=Passalora fulva TaxID=5499 RepID=A0A9Q8UUP7_PASFU|nr:uncharacterized protein CLAFUR5_12066 [Fulvia fulva]KAK4626814.1 hypothetical protein CLAFUR4_04825 [Fulvia fulva]KAK4627532.1 hypothetical protein CLAFUR0_04829 [Fulvia fulva]UJO23095.1 hypothetical protein CLAFUR5_12066 [Fulvia fulva]WPV13283.1 hypothetical protein CLAFUW4_04839 [Fulvia fulva]WPV28495.1 hypothetical protein CLAFUW7_04833 [Fulvia fulva]
MSSAAKLTLAATTVGTIGIVLLVHRQQKLDQAAMHAGVIRDMEQQRIKQERRADFEMQRQLEEQYLKLQKVSDSTDGQVKAK